MMANKNFRLALALILTPVLCWLMGAACASVLKVAVPGFWEMRSDYMDQHTYKSDTHISYPRGSPPGFVVFIVIPALTLNLIGWGPYLILALCFSDFVGESPFVQGGTDSFKPAYVRNVWVLLARWAWWALGSFLTLWGMLHVFFGGRWPPAS